MGDRPSVIVFDVDEALSGMAPMAQRFAAEACGTALADMAADMALVAVHPWDVDGAAGAGRTTVWIGRDGVPYPDPLGPPAHTVSALPDLVGRLG